MITPSPRRTVKIGEAAELTGITPRAIRHYHQIDLLPEPERGDDDRRRYDYDDIVRILWIRRMSELGMRLEDIRTTLAAKDVAGRQALLDELERALAAQEADIQRQRQALRRLRQAGSDVGVLSPGVVELLGQLGSESLRQSDLDALLLTEQILGPEEAVLQAVPHVILATHEDLRSEQERLDEAYEALVDAEADDPRVEELAKQFFAHMQAMDFAHMQAMGKADRAAGQTEDLEGRHAEADHLELPDVEAYCRLPVGGSPAQWRLGVLVGRMVADQIAAEDFES